MLVLLDRDGVINRDARAGILSVAQFEFLPRAKEAIAMLTRAGIKIAVCTNQSAVGHGIMSDDTLQEIHAHMQRELAASGGMINHFYYAPDAPENASDRRKPGPGMLREALVDFSANADETYFVGDMLRDMQAAHAAGCPFILVRSGKGEETLANGWPDTLPAPRIMEDLFAVAAFLTKSAGA